MKLFFTVLLLTLIGNSVFAQTNAGYFTDQSGQTYKTVKIGNQIWMAENLRTTKYANGEDIEFGRPSISNRLVDDPMYVSLSNGQFLYSWKAVNSPKGIAPQGWRVPTKSDWEELISKTTSRGDLKSKTGWPTIEVAGYYQMLTCSNCKNWNSEYRRKVACHVCKDSRRVQGPYVNKSSDSANGNDRLGFNIKHLGSYHLGEYTQFQHFWTSQINTDPKACTNGCDDAFMFNLAFMSVTYNWYEEYLLPVRLIKN
jgi:hypothetical protein